MLRARFVKVWSWQFDCNLLSENHERQRALRCPLLLSTAEGSLQNDGLVAVDKHMIIQHFVESLTEYILLYIAPSLRHILRAKGMIDRNHVLLDDRPFIEIVRHKMRCCTNDFYTALIGLLIRLRTDKSGQETVWILMILW